MGLWSAYKAEPSYLPLGCYERQQLQFTEIRGKGTQVMGRVSKNFEVMFKTPQEHMRGDSEKD